MNGWVSEQADVVTPPYRGRIVRLKLHLPAEDPSVRRCGRGLASLGPHVPWAQAVQRAAFALHLCSRENTLFPGKGNNARLCPEKREKCQAGDLLPQSLQMVYSQKPKSTLHLAIETLRRVRVTGAEVHGLHVSMLQGSHPLCHRAGGHGTQTPSWISPVRGGHLSPNKV